mgnify:CR=1 FL=1
MSDRSIGSDMVEPKLLPENWRIKNFIDVATLQRGKDLPLNLRSPGSYPVIGSNGVAGYHSEFVSQGPGVLVGRSGSVGKVTFVETDFWPLNTTLWVKNFHGNDPKFIYYLLSCFDFGKYTAGVSVPTLNRNLVHPVKVCIPPLPEQRAIARALRAVQGAREARLRELALERERKAALMEHLFTHGTRGEATKMTEIGEMPESWDVVELSNLCIERQGFIQTGPFGSQLHSSDYRECGIPVVNPTHLGYNTINEEYLPFIDKKDADRLSKHYLINGDILISRRGDFKRYSYITDHQSGWLCGTGCILIRVNNLTTLHSVTITN